jgi:hypothetical protein
MSSDALVTELRCSLIDYLISAGYLYSSLKLKLGLFGIDLISDKQVPLRKAFAICLSNSIFVQ